VPQAKPTVYVETTIPSYYFETRQTVEAQAWRAATRSWWKNERPRYRIVTSEVVLAELRLAPAGKSSRCLRLLRDVPLLPEVPQAQDVASFYVKNRLMPSAAGGDAAHLALVSLHRVDFMLTWNCRHLANANKIEHLRVLNQRLRLSIPVIADTHQPRLGDSAMKRNGTADDPVVAEVRLARQKLWRRGGQTVTGLFKAAREVLAARPPARRASTSAKPRGSK